MTPQDKLVVLISLLDGDEQFDPMIKLTIDRIENVLQAESELADWASGELFQRARAEVYGVPAFMSGAL